MKGKSDIGYLVISIDFELNWGVLDRKDNSEYQKNILEGRDSLLRTVELFNKNDIHATVATVGLLFNSSKQQILDNIPVNKPKYEFLNGSPYSNHIITIGEDESKDKLHYGTSLIDVLKKQPNIEIGSHTYSHYYTKDKGNTALSFEEDLELYKRVSAGHNCLPKSIVFPRNQINESYVNKCHSNGITSYRGNEKSWVYSKGNMQTTGILTRMTRIMDAYFNLTGHNTYPLPKYCKNQLTNIPSSRFFRPIRFGPSMIGSKLFSKFKLKRIKKAMSHAAINNEVYHLWWHPHNFGNNRERMFGELEEILSHYKDLQTTYGMKSKSMNDIQEIIKNG